MTCRVHDLHGQLEEYLEYGPGGKPDAALRQDLEEMRARETEARERVGIAEQAMNQQREELARVHDTMAELEASWEQMRYAHKRMRGCSTVLPEGCCC